jgi:hypothetical protein
MAAGGGTCRREGAAVAGNEVRSYLQVVDPTIFTTFDRVVVIWSLRRLEGGCGSVCCGREVRPDLLVWLALGPRVIHYGACAFMWMKCWSLPKVG